MPIPWDKVIMHGPQVLEAAKSLYGKWQSRPKQENIDPDSALQTQVNGLLVRLQALEETEEKQAALIAQLAEQNQALSTGISVLKAEMERYENTIEENKHAQTSINQHCDDILKQLQQQTSASDSLHKKITSIKGLCITSLMLSLIALLIAFLK